VSVSTGPEEQKNGNLFGEFFHVLAIVLLAVSSEQPVRRSICQLTFLMRCASVDLLASLNCDSTSAP
jgi:hypothetical protein